jgi:hypothetical protein
MPRRKCWRARPETRPAGNTPETSPRRLNLIVQACFCVKPATAATAEMPARSASSSVLSQPGSPLTGGIREPGSS